jgi:regulator of replication initiation timing
VLDKISTQEINRMYDAVEKLFKFHLAYLEEGSNDIAPDIVIKFPESDLNKIKKNLKFEFVNFESDFKINSQEYTKEYRTWNHWLWIVPKQEKYSSDNAMIPSTEKIVGDWGEQFKQFEPDMLKQLIEWLLAQIDDLKKDVNSTQNAILDLYRDRLEKARQEITVDYEKQKNVWEPMQQKAKKLAVEFAQLGNFQEEDDFSDQ